MDRSAGVCVSDLPRFLWLYRHWARVGPAAGLPHTDQLPPALPCDERSRLLEALAYLALILATGLPLHSVGRVAWLALANAPQPDDHDGPWWALAWGRMALPRVGSRPRQRPGGESCMADEGQPTQCRTRVGRDTAARGTCTSAC